MAVGLVQVVSEGDLQKRDAEADARAATEESPVDDETMLAAHVHNRFEEFRIFRTTQFQNSQNRDSLNWRMLEALRAYNGQYSSDKLATINQFGGSQAYIKITTVKCRGATALLRDVYANQDRTWDFEATPVPELGEDIAGNIDELVMMEIMKLSQSGEPIDEALIEQRKLQLSEAALAAARTKANEAADIATKFADDLLVEGGFYEALGEFLIDLPIFFFACIKGPIVQMSEEIKWDENGQLVTKRVPKMTWRRVSPFDIYYTPGATHIDHAEVIEKVRYTRADLNALIGLPGYDEEAIRNVLQEYGEGYMEYPDDFENERSDLESREDIRINKSGLIEGLEYHGSVQGSKLLDYAGIKKADIPDPDLDYFAVVWTIGRYVIKAQLDPNPRKHHGYYLTSFEKVPGSIPGHGIPEIIDDSQDIANAAIRSMVNNMSIASGPQVGIIEDRLAPTMDADSLYPWKRWRFESDPMGSTAPPITFFQPDSNATELLGVYKEMNLIADETSAIPRYITGNNTSGGAAATASGLSMLMNNASKVLQSVASQIDREIFSPLLQNLYDMIMLTDTTGILKGDENIRVRGVTVAMQKEQDRMRKLEFLQMTANPIDAEIVGKPGRAAILRDVAKELGMDAKIVPTEADMKEAAKQQQAQAMSAPPASTGNAPPAPGGGGGGSEFAAESRTNTS